MKKLQMLHINRMPYRENGVQGTHVIEMVVEFTDNKWKAIKLIKEEGRPSFARGNPLDMTGEVAPHFMNNPHVLAMVGFYPMDA